ncbi:MAG TPA: GAF domain-containing SpoIIE family protein phosphatase [Xanthomonadales bacterium]|nr:GAF domain-containing SpoIIE family protein phosphatase [Xanthomonadales bacterium]
MNARVRDSVRPPEPQATFDSRALTLLADLSQALAVSIDVEHTLTRAVTRIADCMQAEAASVFMLDPGGQFLECRACAGPVDVRGMRLSVDTGIVGRTIQSNTCQMVRDAQSDPDFAGKVDARTGFTTRSVLCTPLTTTRGPIGVLEVLNKQGGDLFEDADRDMLRLLAAPTALAISNAALVAELVEQNRIKRELKLARQMQRSLLPKRRRDHYPVLGVNRPAREISGDFYDTFELPDGRIAFAIGDVSGKGLDAALLMVRTASLLRWSGKDRLPPGTWLKRVNDELAETVSGGMFVCAAVGYYDPKRKHVEWANAGFPPALVRRADGRFEEYLAEGPPLAILPGIDYPSQQCDLGDDSLYFFSDGVTDVRAADGTTIGLDGVRALLDRHAHAAPGPRLRGLIGELRRLKLADDTTILLIEAAGGIAEDDGEAAA